MRSNKKIKL